MPRKLPSRRSTSVNGAPTRCGFSLLELVAATALIGVTLVSALELMRDGMDLSTETDRRQLLSSYGASQLELQMAATADAWTTGTFAGDYASDGWANIRFKTKCSDSLADGGITNFLMNIETVIYYDTDEDDSPDGDELSCTYVTKIGKFSTYEELTP